jgi:hypothetical protein
MSDDSYRTGNVEFTFTPAGNLEIRIDGHHNWRVGWVEHADVGGLLEWLARPRNGRARSRADPDSGETNS